MGLFRRLLIAFLAILFLLALASESFARAGGGGGFHGGGSGRSGGGGFHSSGGGFRYGGGGGSRSGTPLPPGIVLAIFVIIIVIAILNAWQQQRNQENAIIRRGRALLSDRERANMLAALVNNDPNFDIERFRARIATAFTKIQNAWSMQDLSTVRAFISDGVYERFSLQFGEQLAAGWRNVMENVSVDNVALAQVTADSVFQIVAVRIAARATDYRVRIPAGQVISGTDDSGPFAEVWTFLRRRGAQSLTADGLIEGNCPNCGAAIEMNQNANCAHCGALLRSGEHDWVLTEITQEFEWSSDRPRDLPGVAEITARDPQFNLADLEDTASVVFWRAAAATRIGKSDPLRKLASSKFIESFEPTLKPPPGEARRFYGDCAVGSVQTAGVVSTDEWDNALVQVHWEGELFIAPPGEAPRSTHQRSQQRTVFQLSRRATARSDASRAVSSSHCPSCGAPEAGGTTSACEFCGAVLNDGTRSWILAAINTPTQAANMLATAQPSLAPSRSESTARPAPVAALAWMAKLAVCDGQLDPRERELLVDVARRHDVPTDRLQALLAAARNGNFDPPAPADDAQARQWLTAMADAALADGQIAHAESEMLLKTGQRIGLSRYDVQQLLAQRRTALYAAARHAIED